MSMHEPHEIWMEQCEGAETIRRRYGLQAAFDYVVGEKLLSFAFAAEQHPALARALPQFVSRVREMFAPEQIRTPLDRIEHQWKQQEAETAEDDDPFADSPATAAAKPRRFDTIKELLTMTRLGTS